MARSTNARCANVPTATARTCCSISATSAARSHSSPVRSVNVPSPRGTTSPNIYAMFTPLIKIHYIIKSLNFKIFLHFISAALTQRLPIEREKRVLNFRSSDLHCLLAYLIYLSVWHCVSVSLCMSTALTDVLLQCSLFLGRADLFVQY